MDIVLSVIKWAAIWILVTCLPAVLAGRRLKRIRQAEEARRREFGLRYRPGEERPWLN